MIRVLALAAIVSAVPIVAAAPVANAYDPCERATQAYERALDNYENAQTCYGGHGQPRVCNVPQAEARRLNQARDRMEDACR